jgi:hypothetical protein
MKENGSEERKHSFPKTTDAKGDPHPSVLEGSLNENNSSHYGVHVFPPRGKGVHIQSNLRSKDLKDIVNFMR